MRASTWLGVAIALSACSQAGLSRTVDAPVASSKADPDWSDPAEYRIDRPTEEVGQRIFERTGIGDPYRTGIPYPVFLAMFEMHPELLGESPQALATRFGFTGRKADAASDDRDVREGLPLGLHLTDDPNTHIPFVVHNCALCHADVVKWPGGEKVVLGMGNRRIRIHAFEAALARVVGSPGFDKESVGRVAARISRERGIPWSMDWSDRVVGATIRGLDAHYASRAALLRQASEGLPGRVATIESFAVELAHLLGREVRGSGTIGWAKIPDTIGFTEKRTLSWDGGSEGPSDALVVDADIAAGVRLAWLYAHPLQGASLSTFLRHMPRDLPFPGPIDATLARRGKMTFEHACSRCHGTYEDDGRVRAYVEHVVPIDVLGTDPARTMAVTDDFVAAANDPRLVRGGLKLVTTRRTLGYVPPVLTSIWARAPYGHAGQWPSLAVLATPPARRPIRFVVHADAPLDLERVGVACDEATTAPAGGDYLQDGTAAGFQVTGHPFLADLGADESKAVIEYLKTL
ncbi:MAG TPA: hypothetical protein VF765_14180 [Polyangiaceae bacterium]